jgi:hypothetical protein
MDRSERQGEASSDRVLSRPALPSGALRSVGFAAGVTLIRVMTRLVGRSLDHRTGSASRGAASRPPCPEGAGADLAGQMAPGEADDQVADRRDEKQQSDDVADEAGDEHQRSTDEEHDAVEDLDIGHLAPLHTGPGVIDDPDPGSTDQPRPGRADPKDQDDGEEHPDLLGHGHEGGDLGRSPEDQREDEHDRTLPGRPAGGG